jgi:hypothetical protein
MFVKSCNIYQKKSQKVASPGKNKAFYRENCKKKWEGEHHTSLFVMLFLKYLSPYDIILRIISR